MAYVNGVNVGNFPASENAIHLAPVTEQNVTDFIASNYNVTGCVNQKAFLVTLSYSLPYLVGKGIKIDPVKYPNGYAFRSFTLKDCQICGVMVDYKQTELLGNSLGWPLNDPRRRTHTDGVFIRNGVGQDVKLENISLTFGDQSCTPVLVQSSKLNSLTLKGVKVENCYWNRVIIKADSSIDNLVVDNSQNLHIINEGQGNIKKITVINCLPKLTGFANTEYVKQ